MRERRQGRHRVYRLTPEPLRSVDNWLEWYRLFWRSKLERLKAFAEESWE